MRRPARTGVGHDIRSEAERPCVVHLCGGALGRRCIQIDDRHRSATRDQGS
jgi:hypothetical protein